MTAEANLLTREGRAERKAKKKRRKKERERNKRKFPKTKQKQKQKQESKGLKKCYGEEIGNETFPFVVDCFHDFALIINTKMVKMKLFRSRENTNVMNEN